MLGSIATPRRTGSVLALAITVVCVLAFALRGGAAHAAIPQVVPAGGSPIYGTCTGQKSGVIKGDATAAGHVGQWNVVSISDGLTSPRDAASGLPTGQLQHSQIRVSMLAGPQTVRLIQSLTTNEVLTSCQFWFYRPSPTGAQTNYLRIQLSNAGIGSYTLTGVANSKVGTTFTFTYQHIAWTWTQGGVTASDTWGGVA
ncbi:hypothetical protein Back2_12310 [Nocardioides baekrokdamisoli]|uniref:Uncharacterized protein n=1 Tax=Nocardioides baekrokdamisoli TaxID=1804624 RepID=A0A3G9J0F2_9ACTN|nr:type VI secretion system tube protein TssD [Nocardioides baekrokdamisoli]BBH16944.1 hypothetical protein Back2_12310 [Nocardioides baekrokdamisoli]